MGRVISVRLLVLLLVSGLGVCVVGGYLGAYHPVGDSLAVFRFPIAAAFALVVIWTPWRRAIRWPLSIAALLVMASVTLQSLFEPTLPSDFDFRLYQQNLLFARHENGKWIENVEKLAPEFITLQEVSGRNKAVLEQLRSQYPAQQYCDFASIGGVAVLSRYPLRADSGFCVARKGLAAMQVETPHGLVWLVSVHLHWPFPFRQAEQAAELIPVLEQLEGHVIVGGDFNAVAWSNVLREFAKAIGGSRVPHGDVTFVLPKIKMPVTIDHVLTGPAFAQSATSLERLGSDHNGVLAYLTRGQGAEAQ